MTAAAAWFRNSSKREQEQELSSQGAREACSGQSQSQTGGMSSGMAVRLSGWLCAVVAVRWVREQLKRVTQKPRQQQPKGSKAESDSSAAAAAAAFWTPSWKKEGKRGRALCVAVSSSKECHSSSRRSIW